MYLDNGSVIVLRTLDLKFNPLECLFPLQEAVKVLVLSLIQRFTPSVTKVFGLCKGTHMSRDNLSKHRKTLLMLHMPCCKGSAYPSTINFSLLYIFNLLNMTDFLTGCRAPCYYHPLVKRLQRGKSFHLQSPPHNACQHQANKQWLPSFCVYFRQTAVAAVGSIKPDALKAAADFTEKDLSDKRCSEELTDKL